MSELDDDAIIARLKKETAGVTAIEEKLNECLDQFSWSEDYGAALFGTLLKELPKLSHPKRSTMFMINLMAGTVDLAKPFAPADYDSIGGEQKCLN